MTTETLLDTTTNPPATMVSLAPIPRLLLRPNEAALALGISSRLLWSRTRDGSIPCIRIGKAVRYDPRALAEMIANMKTAR